MSCECFHAQKAAKLAGYHSPTSGDSPEKIYATPSEEEYLSGDWHSESAPRKSLSPASKKRDHDEFEAELDALSTHSSDPEEPTVFDPIGKTPEEIADGARNSSAVTGGRWPSAVALELKVYIMLLSCILHALM